MKLAMTIIAAVAAVQWLLFALWYLFAREPFPKKGLRGVDKRLLGSSIVLAAGFLVNVDYASLWKGKTPAVQASAAATSHGSCASLESGMTIAEVKKRMGEPDASRADEETRGPGAVTLAYDASRCEVHVFDGKVEFVE